MYGSVSSVGTRTVGTLAGAAHGAAASTAYSTTNPLGRQKSLCSTAGESPILSPPGAPAACGVLGRRAVAQGRGAVSVVVVVLEVADDHAGLEQSVSVVAVEALLPESVVLDFVMLKAVRAVERFRKQGKTVLLHCVEARSRTPTVAALYGVACSL